MAASQTKPRQQRSALKQYVGQLVIGNGWVTSWEDHKKKETVQLYIEKPTIKIPDKNILFSNLQTISKEHHINYFIDYSDLPDKNNHQIDKYISLYEQGAFIGNIIEYKRKDGSIDYGIKPTPFSLLEDDLQYLLKFLKTLLDNLKPSNSNLLRALELEIKPELIRLEQRLEQAGDSLPTFINTYSDYKKELNGWKDRLSQITKYIRWAHSNRKLRRMHKIKDKSALSIPTYSFEINDYVANM